MQLEAIQKALGERGLDGWLFYSFRDNDPIALNVLGLSREELLSRRWFYLVPASGEPVKLVHRIEPEALDRLPGKKLIYLPWRELEAKLGEMLRGLKRVAMQYSPRNSVPYVSRVDAGTVELVRSFGVEVVSSGDLVQMFESRWSRAQLDMHVEAAEALRRIIDQAFAEIARAVAAGRRITEYDIQQFICDAYKDNGLVTSHLPIVAVNANAALPHYQPTGERHSEIKRGDLVLLDIWAKRDAPDAVYADITWTGYVGSQVPERIERIFEIVRGARDAAYGFVDEAARAGRPVYGWQADEVARSYIRERGYGEYFLHRTGHSIGVEVHGTGANLDNLETRDERMLLPGTAFSIEPGIYLDDFGIRSEIDVYFGDGATLVAGQPIQSEVIRILD